MKPHPILVVIMIFIIGTVSAQDRDRIIQGKANLEKIIKLIKNDNIMQLADLVKFPLKRPDPIPNIETKESFVFYYSTLIDSNLRQMLIDTTQSFKDMIVDPYNYSVGFHRGDIYLTENGLIECINYSSNSETELIQKLSNETLSRIHSSVKKWEKPILVLKSETFLIRVDLMEDNSLRYISWSGTKSISDKPDLILFNGIQDFRGSMGSVTYTFKNGEWTYVVDFTAICGPIENCGYFLRLFQNEDKKKSIRMTRIK